jgi:hypothetical protein
MVLIATIISVKEGLCRNTWRGFSIVSLTECPITGTPQEKIPKEVTEKKELV